MEPIQVTWNEYHRLVITLAIEIEDKLGRRPTQVIGIMTGGFFAAKLLATRWNTPLAVLSIQSYDGDVPRADADVHFKRKLLNNAKEFGKDAVLVDDLTESGRTLRLTQAFLQEQYMKVFDTITVATVFHKATSAVEPDCYARLIEAGEDGKCPWVIQPWDGSIPSDP